MYVSLEEFRKILTGVDSPNDSDYKGTPAELEDGILETHLEDATAQINDTLRTKYDIPFPDNNIPQLIKAITRALAQYQSDLTYKKTNGYQSLNYAFILRYNWAIKQLELLRTGKLQLFNENDSDSLVVPHYDSLLFPASRYLRPVRKEYYNGWEFLDTY